MNAVIVFETFILNVIVFLIKTSCKHKKSKTSDLDFFLADSYDYKTVPDCNSASGVI